MLSAREPAAATIATVDTIALRMSVHNGSEELLEVVLEPYGRDYWLQPGESLLVHTAPCDDHGAVWPGTAKGNEPFEVDYHPGLIRVHFNGTHGWVTDLADNELDCGHQRP
ncbi:hypothetical protein Axi01nite_59300 [Actinoplanes xinjiangensis]|nr:hypothetical protein Axi01nite_59300 [Actinoplanes xinjiangensis]